MLSPSDLLRAWFNWRDDNRCARPESVTCQGCGRIYPPQKSAPVMVFECFALVKCSECGKERDDEN